MKRGLTEEEIKIIEGEIKCAATKEILSSTTRLTARPRSPCMLETEWSG